MGQLSMNRHPPRTEPGTSIEGLLKDSRFYRTIRASIGGSSVVRGCHLKAVAAPLAAPGHHLSPGS
ncbi:hypothetical protein BOSEA31B_20233 [Hyphomicrobiales bacterium]|nr:hypothetical protein BOSEA31B_20233 [Hyphomicrobiales bacterium]CAH1702395.1 hypothetical protein BOSEA1005_30267 [Hyphomicrobiales bacterium]